MKCPHCNSPMHGEHDRVRCLICGHSQWSAFQVRRPSGSERRGGLPAPGGRQP